MTDGTSQHDSYAAAYLSDYGFEQVMVAQRRRFLLDLLGREQPDCVVEICCGMEPLFAVATGFNRWITIEPAEVFVERARRAATGDRRVTVIQSPVQAVDWTEVLATPPDLILLSSLLHEVAEPETLLAAVHFLAGPDTLVHANVPNADSLHRRLAVSMGLITRSAEPSARNKDLMQNRVFDAAEFRAVFERSGFQVISEGGYFMKPFTHAQMDAIRNTIGPDVLEGLYVLGCELPELASEIHLGARKR